FRCSRCGCAARRARWRSEGPIRQACGIQERSAWADLPIVRASLIQEPVRDAVITVNPAIAKKRPVAANVFQLLKIALADQDLLFIMRGLYDDSAKRIAEEGAAPEFQALALGAVTANVAEFMPDAVYRSDKHAVSNGVRPLNRAPGIVLRGSEFSLFIRMPADCGGIKENVCSLKGREPRAFGIPLVPANQRAHAAVV